MSGKIVILNGTSCSGKSTTARALQETMPEPYMHVGIDHFERMQPRQGGGYNQVFYGEGLDGRDLLPTMHNCVASMAAEGVNVVVEHILLKRRWLRNLVDCLVEFDPLFVGVSCTVDELLRREGERSRRPENSQIERHFKHIDVLFQMQVFDLVIDTTQMSTGQCVESIQRELAKGGKRKFRNLVGHKELESNEEFWR